MGPISSAIVVPALLVASLADCDGPGRGIADIETKPNVLLVVVDTLRADRLRCYNPSSRPTPHVDELARSSHRFAWALAQAPCTKPSMWNIVTSRYQSRVPLPRFRRPTTMGTFFADLGYGTAAFLNKTKLGKDPGLARGFDVFSVGNSREGGDSDRASIRTPLQVVEMLDQWLEQKGRRPFFGWLVFNDPHRPYNPPEPFRGRFARGTFDRRSFKGGLEAPPRNLTAAHAAFLGDAYDEEVHFVDHAIERLLSMLRRRGLFDSTLIVFTADHGEELGDNGGLWSHCIRCSLEEAHVPLLIKLPHQREGRVVDEPAQLVDVFPTIVDVVGAAVPDDLQGTSLLSLMSGTPSSSAPRPAACYWKSSRLVLNDGYALETGEGLSKLVSLEGRQPLRGRLDLERELLEAAATIAHAPDDEDARRRDEMIERMRALGYVQ